ncbi:MAG: HD domain-containing protein [Patescibacteria group bacterium]
MNIFNKILPEAKKFFLDARGSHNFEHTERVMKLCMHIGKKEKADLKILKIAAVLHDIGRKFEDESKGKICHAKKSAELARKILKKYNFPQSKIEKVAHCIEAHRFRNEITPQTLEAKVLFDADKLDSIGAIGIGRAFFFANEVGAKLHESLNETEILKTKPYTKDDTAYREFVVKLRHIKGKMLTREGKRLAKERHKFMVEFFERLEKETSGEQ